MFLLNGKTEQTLKALDNLLLSEYESKAYFALLVKGECKPMDVVRLSGIPDKSLLGSPRPGRKENGYPDPSEADESEAC